MMIKGIAASNGYTIAPAFKMCKETIAIEKRKIDDLNEELIKLDEAIQESRKDIEKLKDKAIESLGKDKAQIFEAHLLLTEDPELIATIKSKIEEDKVCAEFAVKTVSDMFIDMFKSMDNDYMRERAVDIQDVSDRFIRHLLKIDSLDSSEINEAVIVVSDDLTPSDTIQLDRSKTLGFATNIGGPTSHSAILARTMEIPAVVGTQHITEDVKDGDLLILDGVEGLVIVNPTSEELESYKKKIADYEEQKHLWKQFKDQASFTKDGHQIELGANIGSVKDVDKVLENGGEGVGLFRTEFLYMDRTDFPDEAFQFQTYRSVLEALEGKPCVIRTLDIGGDKDLSYWQLPKEMNPFLGYRAIRICLDQKEVFRTQLRALLRASVYGNLKVMFPMIATVNELKEAKSFLLSVKNELIDEGYEVSDTFEVGMMVEIPATAVLAHQFAKYVDFFSIGTNDLIQYTMAADRMNAKVSYLYQPYNPSILTLVHQVIEAAHAEGKWVGMCGEMAGDQIAFPILIGLGLDEFSMSAPSILSNRYLASKLNYHDLKSIAMKALTCESQEQVVELVKEFLEE